MLFVGPSIASSLTPVIPTRLKGRCTLRSAPLPRSKFQRSLLRAVLTISCLTTLSITVQGQTLPNVAAGKPVSASAASETEPLSIATDGNVDTNPFIRLPGAQQWVEVDLQGSYDISQLQFFHYWGDNRTYHDVVARISPDRVTFTTVFNNDGNGSAGFGVGTDAEYADTYAGKTVTLASPICARYVRLYSNGSTVNGFNHYVEVRSFGSASSAPCSSPPSANVALNKPVSASAASESAPLSIATDGGIDTNPFIRLPSGQHWIEVDLQANYDLTQLQFFHYWGDHRTYRDVVVRLSADHVTYATVFNNDVDGSSGFGVGGDAEYAESYAGKTVTLSSPICARYVRLYSNGSTVNTLNHYVELRSYGSASSGSCASTTPGNVALSKPVSASAPSETAPLSIATDGDIDTNPFIRLPAGQQWVEVDLQGSYDISQLQFFHYWGDQRTYHDVVARLSADGVTYTTVFNNDGDGSAGFGPGTDLEYAESYAGKMLVLPMPVCARYVRLYSNGSTVNALNHYVEVRAVGVPSAACASPPTRDATLWPFTTNSPWNMPIGSGAQFEGFTAPCTSHVAGPGLSAWINASQFSHPVYRAHASDPSVGVFDEGQQVATIQSPADATPSLPEPGSGWWDGHLHILDSAGRYVHEMWKAERRSDGGWNVWYYDRNDLYSSGILNGGTRAYGGSAIGGLIRSGELANGIPHALAFALPQWRMRPLPVWPANVEDENNSYSGNAPMGTLAAIPGSVDLTQLSPPLGAQGLIIGKALQDYGAYLVDSAGANPEDDDLVLYVETHAASELATQAIEDLRRLRSLLRCVTNNGSSNIGGGGTPRAPLAPPLGTPP